MPDPLITEEPMNTLAESIARAAAIAASWDARAADPASEPSRLTLFNLPWSAAEAAIAAGWGVMDGPKGNLLWDSEGEGLIRFDWDDCGTAPYEPTAADRRVSTWAVVMP